MSPIRIGVIGLSATSPTSWAANVLIPPLLKSPLNSLYTLKALCTSSEQSAAAAKQKYSEIVGHPINAYYGDSGATDISKDPEVDLVIVAIKAPEHKSALLQVIEAGKDFFVEWPAGNGLKETEEIALAARAKGVKSIVGSQARNSLVLDKVREIIKSGKIGRIVSTSVIGNAPAEIEFWGPRVKTPDGYTVDETKGASLLDIGGGHFLAGFLHALGSSGFSSVSSTTKIAFPKATVVDSEGNPTGVEVTATNPDQVAFTGILKDIDAISSIHLRGGLKSLPGRSALTWIIDGEEGTIKLDNPILMINVYEPVLTLNGEVVEVDAEGRVPELSGKGASGNITRAWAEYAEGAGGYSTIEDALNIKRIIDAVNKSSKEGRRVETLISSIHQSYSNEQSASYATSTKL